MVLPTLLNVIQFINLYKKNVIVDFLKDVPLGVALPD